LAPTIPRIELRMDDLERLIERARYTPLSDEEYATLKAAIDTLGYVAHLVEEKGTTLAGLRQMLFGTRTEKTRDVLKRAGVDDTEKTTAEASGGDEASASPTGREPAARGHGRHGVEAYAGATHVEVPHARVTHGDRCPECAQGTVYRQRDPGVLVRMVGQAPIAATVYALEKLRCHLCGELFTADPPPGVGSEKYDATTGAMVALLKYGSGVPFHRLERLQANVRIPLPASTQWEIVADTATRIQPALEELIRQAAQGEVIHNDDTSMTVLALGGPRSPLVEPGAEDEIPPNRTGIFTSGIVATRDGHRLALFFTGRRHAGENLARVLAERAADLGPPIQMCDALSRNLPKPLDVILGHCLAHARRRFVDVTPSFPAECRHVLETLREVYRHDAQARDQGLSPDARLTLHRAQSGPLMAQLHDWLTDQIAAHHVEPNSGLGQAIAYLINHWTPLTLFLRQPGAPLDNNLCERALKKTILHRKNALFYKTPNGAHVGDLFMSLIHTCELAGVNPFEYLTELQRHADDLARNPASWMPSRYRDTLQQLGPPLDLG
jgi:transposase